MLANVICRPVRIRTSQRYALVRRNASRCCVDLRHRHPVICHDAVKHLHPYHLFHPLLPFILASILLHDFLSHTIVVVRSAYPYTPPLCPAR